mgnify:CR=1 FL=1
MKEMQTGLGNDRKEMETGLRHDIKILETRMTVRSGSLVVPAVSVVATLLELFQAPRLPTAALQQPHSVTQKKVTSVLSQLPTLYFFKWNPLGLPSCR